MKVKADVRAYLEDDRKDYTHITLTSHWQGPSDRVILSTTCLAEWEAGEVFELHISAQELADALRRVS